MRSLLTAAGFMTRLAALWTCVNLMAAWGLVHRFQYFGNGSDHGETIVLYLAVYATLAVAGPGKYSLDYKLRR